MILNPGTLMRILIVAFVMVMVGLSIAVYRQVLYVQNQRRQYIYNFYDEDMNNASYVDALSKNFSERLKNVRRILKIKSEIKRINLRQKIYNTHFMGPVFNGTYVVVIQVHSNVYLLKQLLASLRTAHSINNALLIFSHDVYSTEINNAVHTVNFAKYMQIFYPYSIQLHPNVFPGVDSKCKEDNTCDQNKHRDPAAAQVKHHWWWQMNQIFDNIKVLQNHTNSILHLEEDNYVTADFLVVHRLLENVRNVHCPVCEMISMGSHEPDLPEYTRKRTVITFEVWGREMSRIGISFDRGTWRAIKGWNKDFCFFNDYSWDNSLKYIGSKHMDTNFYFTSINAPRVFRFESCDEEDSSCQRGYKVDELKKFVELIHGALFPSILALKILSSEEYVVKPQGYFDDEKDHELCMYFSKNNVCY